MLRTCALAEPAGRRATGPHLCRTKSASPGSAPARIQAAKRLGTPKHETQVQKRRLHKPENWSFSNR
eukprot:6196727-Pleurochrysis_carterae.AAC.2